LIPTVMWLKKWCKCTFKKQQENVFFFNWFLLALWRPITEIRGSGFASRSGSEFGSISQRHGSVDPDPDQHQNVIDPDPEHCPKKQLIKTNFSHLDARFFWCFRERVLVTLMELREFWL
jgi:hypothetical protein